MNTRNLPASALFLVIGAGTVLFIGAFTRVEPANSLRPPAASLTNPPLVMHDDPPAQAPAEHPLPARLSPGLSELVKLAQAHVDEGVILAYIKSSHQVFTPTADEILYLSDLGLSQDVIGAVVGAPPAVVPQPEPAIAAAPAPAPVTEAPPAAVQPVADASANMFYNDLAPYGAWVQQPDYGLVWQPTVTTINPDWSPYVDAGQWLYSDSGWYWQSDYSWGWAPFHYGRWANIPRQGWVWQPGNVWAPAWVSWRSSSSYIGWAPLPPGVSLNVLAQLTYHSKPVGPNATLGLPASAYTFVNLNNLTSRALPRHAVPAAGVGALVQSSIALDTYAIVNNRIFVGGVNPEVVATARQKPVRQVALRAVSSPDAAGLALDRKTLAVYVPPAASSERQSPANTSRAEPTIERASTSELGQLAENDSAPAVVAPAAAEASQVSVQLPPLHYPAPAVQAGAHHHLRETTMAPEPASGPFRHEWPRGYATTVEQPSTPAPRLNGFNPPARQLEPPRFAVESRSAPAESRSPSVEPPHAAPAPPAAPSSSGSSKSGK